MIATADKVEESITSDFKVDNPKDWAIFYLGKKEEFVKETFLPRINLPLGNVWRGDYTPISAPKASDADASARDLYVGKFRPTTRSVSIQKWEGIVLETRAESFLARLTDLAHEEIDEEAEIGFEEVPLEDHALIEPGAVFYFSFGYDTAIDGQVRRSSMLRFRRLPAWTKSDIEKAREETKRIKQTLGW